MYIVTVHLNVVHTSYCVKVMDQLFDNQVKDGIFH